MPDSISVAEAKMTRSPKSFGRTYCAGTPGVAVAIGWPQYCAALARYTVNSSGVGEVLSLACITIVGVHAVHAKATASRASMRTAIPFVCCDSAFSRNSATALGDVNAIIPQFRRLVRLHWRARCAVARRRSSATNRHSRRIGVDAAEDAGPRRGNELQNKMDWHLRHLAGITGLTRPLRLLLAFNLTRRTWGGLLGGRWPGFSQKWPFVGGAKFLP